MNDTTKREIAAYTLGRVEQFIEDYARSSQISAHELADRVATLLSAQTSGSVLRAYNRVPTLRRRSTARGQAARQMAVVSGSHRQAQVDKTKPKRRYKTLSAKQLAAMRRNIAKGRASRLRKQREAQRLKEAA